LILWINSVRDYRIVTTPLNLDGILEIRVVVEYFSSTLLDNAVQHLELTATTIPDMESRKDRGKGAKRTEIRQGSAR